VQAQQESFVLAAILIAVLFADRLGGSSAVSRRIYQVSLGLVLALAVVAGTNAFIRPPELPLSALRGADILSGTSGEQLSEDLVKDLANRASEAATVQAAAAVVFVLAGLLAIQRWRTVGLGIATGGIILVLFSGSGIGRAGSCTNGFNSTSPTFGFSSEGRDIAQFLVFLIGALVLVAFGHWRWDRTEVIEPDPAVL
jgi:hypothetical protein